MSDQGQSTAASDAQKVRDQQELNDALAGRDTSGGDKGGDDKGGEDKGGGGEDKGGGRDE